MALVVLPANAQSSSQGQAQPKAPAKPGAPDTPKFDPAVAALLKQATATYHKLHSYRHTEVIRAAVAGSTSSVTVTLAIERPNKLILKSDNDQIGVAFSNGKTVILFNPGTIEYTKQPAPTDLSAMPDIKSLVLSSAAPAIGSVVVEEMLAGDVLADAFLKNLFTGASVGAAVQKNGKKVQPIVILPGGKAEAGSFTLDFDADTHLLQDVVLKSPQGSLTDTLSNIKTDTTLPAETFQYTPPSQAKLVDAFTNPEEAVEKAAIAKYQGKPAPDFTLKDPSGKEYKLSSLKGKVVVVDFWASWCGPCQMVMPTIQEISAKLSSQGVQVLAVDTWDAKSDFDSFVKANPQYTMTFLLDPAQKDAQNSVATKLYGVEGIPTTMVIDKNGIVHTYAIGVHEHDFYFNALKEVGVNIVVQ
jgi:thiol-disulfide isomerase/thioredoxin/outer membrane lipoprotein-sorting protein